MQPKPTHLYRSDRDRVRDFLGSVHGCLDLGNLERASQVEVLACKFCTLKGLGEPSADSEGGNALLIRWAEDGLGPDDMGLMVHDMVWPEMMGRLP